MNLGKNIMMIVSLMVAVIIALAVLVPVIQDTSASEDTLTNTGYMRYTAISSTDDTVITISWDHTDPTNLTVNDKTFTINAPSGQTMSMVFANNFNLRYNTTGPAMDCYGTVNNTVSASVSDATDITLTLSSGTATVTNTADTPVTATYSYTTAYYPSDNGEYIMKYSNGTAYVNPDSTVIIANGMTIVGNRIGVYFDGTIEDGYTFNYFNTSATVSATDVVSDYEDVANYEDVVALSKITMHLTKGTDEVDATYSYFLVPYEVTAERSVHVTPIEASLLGIIPLLVVIGIVIGAVWFIRQRN